MAEKAPLPISESKNVSKSDTAITPPENPKYSKPSDDILDFWDKIDDAF